MKLTVKTLTGAEAGEIELNDQVFAIEPRRDILHRMVRYQLAKRRAGTHKTKGISEISGTTKKPYKQKGTGRARQGSLRSPQFRGGARIFGPVVRSHAHDLPKKVRRLALRSALSAKAQAGELIVIDTLAVETHKTKVLAQQLSQLGIRSAVMVDAVLEDRFVLATRNLSTIDVMPVIGANVYDILRREHLVISRAALAGLEARALGLGASGSDADAEAVTEGESV